MPLSSLAAKRRSARNSYPFQLALTTLLALFAALTWHLYATQRLPSIMTSQDLGGKPSSFVYVPPVGAGQAQQPIPTDSSLHVAIDAQGTTTTNTITMPLRLLSYNVRYDNPHPITGEQPWRVRGPKLATQLRFLTEGHDNAFLCLQECLRSQVDDIQARLGAGWAHIGRGRDARATDGEFSPVYYRAAVWNCTHTETRWLSETPHTPSRGWDAALNRIVTIGEFTHRARGTKVVVMSTHFDHVGVRARENSARLLIAIAREWSGRAEGAAVLVGGDFNSTPDDGAYKVMVAEGSGMSDISDLVAPEDRYGNHLTYTSFGEPGEGPQRIDFLFIQEPRAAVIKSFGVLPNSFDDKVRLSDHRPVVADMDVPI
ncbi:endonuclease/exonuclease/phosphatase [Cordyceps militaris CM01]|uniref:Endonuclease/exonuclease/phosphatase n=1 Tax=Cordyceps militaris (strain CM01) TaxID=983644 RepID=G3JKN7_CORMM|nr:endonuclease/exonuclease/phosphatase [Cordyceps militaris CM01]EGX91476.1 endonuclease/exonuclease/phosphatase [Cordyceps militaris CM01]